MAEDRCERDHRKAIRGIFFGALRVFVDELLHAFKISSSRGFVQIERSIKGEQQVADFVSPGINGGKKRGYPLFTLGARQVRFGGKHTLHGSEIAATYRVKKYVGVAHGDLPIIVRQYCRLTFGCQRTQMLRFREDLRLSDNQI